MFVLTLMDTDVSGVAVNAVSLIFSFLQRLLFHVNCLTLWSRVVFGKLVVTWSGNPCLLWQLKVLFLLLLLLLYLHF